MREPLKQSWSHQRITEKHSRKISNYSSYILSDLWIQFARQNKPGVAIFSSQVFRHSSQEVGMSLTASRHVFTSGYYSFLKHFFGFTWMAQQVLPSNLMCWVQQVVSPSIRSSATTLAHKGSFEQTLKSDQQLFSEHQTIIALQQRRQQGAHWEILSMHKETEKGFTSAAAGSRLWN